MVEHGTITAWVRGKCRCEHCETVWREYQDSMYATRDPRTFPQERQAEFLAKVAAGMTIGDAAWELRVSKSTVVLLARSRPEFRDALDDALRASPQRHQRDRWSPSHGTREAFMAGCTCNRCRHANALHHHYVRSRA